MKPTSSQLDNGEIAVNYHKGTERLFIKNDNEEVVEFVSKDEVDKKQDKVDGVNIVRKEFEEDYGTYTEGVIEIDNGVYNAMVRNNQIIFTYDSDKGGIFFEPIEHSIDGKNFPGGVKCKHKKTDDPLNNDLRIARMCDLPSQVQSDWNETNTTSKAYILNKPTIPTNTSDLNNDSGFLTEHQDISGKQDVLISGTNIKTINNNSIVGSGNLDVGTITGVTINNTTKTPTNGTVDLGTVLTTTTSSVTSGSTTPITSGGVYSALQNYETKLAFTTSSNTSYTATRNQYCRFTTTLSSLGISLPTSSLVAGDTCAFNFTTSSSFSSFTISGGTIKKMKDFAIEANGTYEVVALYDGDKWLVTVTKFE